MYAITVNNFIRKIIIPSIMLIFIPTNLQFPYDILSIPLFLFLILHPHLALSNVFPCQIVARYLCIMTKQITEQQAIEERQKYVAAFNDTMIKIWKEQITLLDVIVRP